MAEKCLPSPEVLRQLVRYEPETGRLFWRTRTLEHQKNPKFLKVWNTRFAGKEAFTCDCGSGYRQGRIFDIAVRAHRVAWAVHHGRWPDDQIDHINGNKSDNRLSNLRCVSRAENAKNQSVQKRSKSGIIGVRFFKRTKKWIASIKVDGHTFHLGYFDKIEDAAMARAEAETAFGFHENHGRKASR